MVKIKKGVVPALYLFSVIFFVGTITLFQKIAGNGVLILIGIMALFIGLQFLVKTIGAKSEEGMRRQIIKDLVSFYVTKMDMSHGDALVRANQVVDQYGVVEMSIQLEKFKGAKI